MRRLALMLLLMGCQPQPQPDIDSGEPVVVEDRGSSDGEVRDLSGCRIREEIRICHRPGSPFHDTECNGLSDPDGCYLPGEETAFCWLLSVSSCGGEEYDEWHEKYCPMLIDCQSP